ncbi:MAG: hypothetical protein KF784_05785 [Fimbriimonadaceae bacterium]|nr:hypothetical protein [Fimbriimonadaceae bacterium]
MNKNRDFVFAAVAMDVGGIPAAKPHYDKAKATYLTLVDSQNALADAFGFQLIPNGFLIDEAGVLRYQKVGGFEVRSPATQKEIDAFLALPSVKSDGTGVEPVDDRAIESDLRDALSQTPNDGHANLELGRFLHRQGKSREALLYLRRAATEMPKSSPAQFTYGSALLATGDKTNATIHFKQALRYDRDNFVIRKQIWMVEHPERFHPEIDWNWQREQLKKEKEQEKLDPPAL